MVSIDSKRRSDAFPISAYQTGRSGNFVDHRRDFDARFLKREEVWCDRTAFLGNGLLKNLVARPRPCHRPHDYFMLITIPKDYSFPSGHTFSSVAAAIGIWHWNRKWGIAAVVTAILMMFSRLYFYVHYPTDILGGILLGTVLALLSIQIVEKTLASERWKNWRNKRRDER